MFHSNAPSTQRTQTGFTPRRASRYVVVQARLTETAAAVFHLAEQDRWHVDFRYLSHDTCDDTFTPGTVVTSNIFVPSPTSFRQSTVTHRYNFNTECWFGAVSRCQVSRRVAASECFPYRTDTLVVDPDGTIYHWKIRRLRETMWCPLSRVGNVWYQLAKEWSIVSLRARVTVIKNESLSSLSLHATQNHFPLLLQRIARGVGAPIGNGIDKSGMLKLRPRFWHCGISYSHLHAVWYFDSTRASVYLGVRASTEGVWEKRTHQG